VTGDKNIHFEGIFEICPLTLKPPSGEIRRGFSFS
jgi:hypothetical protein